MTTFETPEPISVTIELGVGDIQVAASDRSDTIVEVRPSDPGRKDHVIAAEQTRVEYDGGRLQIRAPKPRAPRGWRQYTSRGGGESVDVAIELPAGSELDGEAAVAALRSTGRLGECRFKTGVGEIRLDQVGPLRLRTGAGDISVDRVAGPAEITTGSGALRVAGVDGAATVKNTNGDTWIGEVAGDLRASAANGKIAADRTLATVVAKTANGDIRLGDVRHGEIVAETGFGKVDIGVGDGVAAWLELTTSFGRVHSELEAADRPAAGEDVVEVHARTAYGDITIRRAPEGRPGLERP